MPRYRYECSNCGVEIIVFHGLEETFSDCEKCEQPNTMKKLLSRPLTLKKPTTTSNKKIGDLTKEYIEENRKVLEQQKKEAKQKTHDPS
tara:strand:+ start:519 stop:785 length:267 start_codon:yes stop_codon:yes gene_type:complete